MNQAAQSNVDVTIGATGYNPYRNSQLASTDLWVKAGMPAELAENYTGRHQRRPEQRQHGFRHENPGRAEVYRRRP